MGSGEVPLLAYVSAAQADLMLGTPMADNPSDMLPEPGVMGDPCEVVADVTLSKVWNDWDNFTGERPGSVTLYIYRVGYAPDGDVTEETYSPESKNPFLTVELSASDQQTDTPAIWRQILEDMPLSLNETDENGQPAEPIVYYSYSVEEAAVAGYSLTAQSVDDHLRSFTVVNTVNLILPLAGGVGDLWFIIIGAGLLMAMILRHRRRKRSEKR